MSTMVSTSTRIIGRVGIVRSEIIATDPCYDDSIESLNDFQLRLIGEIGFWNASIEVAQGSSIVRKLHLRHEKYSDSEVVADKIFIISVDSGQFGIFCRENFSPNDKKWYLGCAQVTCNSALRAGLVYGGVVASSGNGDGLYPVRVKYNEAGKAIDIEASFIGIDDEDDES